MRACATADVQRTCATVQLQRTVAPAQPSTDQISIFIPCDIPCDIPVCEISCDIPGCDISCDIVSDIPGSRGTEIQPNARPPPLCCRTQGGGQWGGYITCDITYMIYYETLLLVHAYDIIVFAYDIAHMIYYVIYQCNHVTMKI